MSDSASTISTPSSTTAKLGYLVPPDGGVQAYYHINSDPITGEKKTNIGHELKEVVIENVRGREDTVSLDTTGFQFFHHPVQHKSFNNDEEIIREYYPESVELLKKLTGGTRVEIFDHTVRRRRPGQIDDSPDRRQPVSQVHIDQTNKAAVVRLERHLPASEAAELQKRRFQIINLWRPINHPAYDWPLALCDFRSVDQKDVFRRTLVFKDREGENFGVKYNKDHKWKYLYGMTPDELVLIKCFDSVQDGSVALYTPHTGFEDPATPVGSLPRESIELRAFVFYD
ncbi:hypothetical protein CPB84DRAFT_1749842 [Gymnopilus junonius]|uniref:7alpha-cephem-methoxylase P8 chain n=1 Tax=Gymnopilus junonius TaxID=109634 RepID=A0A9P5TKD8_GYMJU|nr:hypothetical protein CPB84DRAFT_1749842 [Gymnopilus junonius]